MTVNRADLKKKVRVVFDLDGVFASGTVEEVYSDAAGWAYEKCKPIQDMIDLTHALSDLGVVVVIHTARWEKDRVKTVHWLRRHNVYYDDLIFGKPSADIYVDDRSFPAFEPSIMTAGKLFLKIKKLMQIKNSKE